MMQCYYGVNTVQQNNTSASAAISLSPTARSQVKATEQLDQLVVVKLNAFLTVGGRK
jgi:hypothetical protein